MQLNAGLKLGPDFGGHESPLLMPARHRNIGRFFAEVGKGDPAILTNTSHHVLIISGLYGFLFPEEQIQAYSCHVEDPQISEIWKENSLLTSLALAYINKFSIRMVLDLTGQDSYRTLLEWDRIAKKARAVHFFSEQYAGAAALPSLGELARTILLSESEEKIAAIRPESSIYLDDHGRIYVTESATPPQGFPTESPNPVQGKAHLVDLGEEPSAQVGLESSEFLDYTRDIPVTSGEHKTVFDRRIASINDLPTDVQGIFRSLSRCPDALEVFLGRFFRYGSNRPEFILKLSTPQPGSGHIFCKLEGPGAIARKQNVDIRVTKGRELIAYQIISGLISKNQLPPTGENLRDEEDNHQSEERSITKAHFKAALNDLLSKAYKRNSAYLDVSSGGLHRIVGQYPGRNHRMPLCCDVMRSAMKQHDEILSTPPRGNGASLTIRYYLDR